MNDYFTSEISVSFVRWCAGFVATLSVLTILSLWFWQALLDAVWGSCTVLLVSGWHVHGLHWGTHTAMCRTVMMSTQSLP
jgi:hypothetical protein